MLCAAFFVLGKPAIWLSVHRSFWEVTMPRNIQAVLCVVVAVFCFNLNDSLMKSLFLREPVYVIVGVRAVMVMGLLTTVILVLVRQNPLKGFSDRGTLLFGFGEAMVAIPYLSALMFLTLGVSAALIFTAPVITTALGALFLREKVGVFRWGAVVLGFGGVTLIALGEPLTRMVAPDLALSLYGAQEPGGTNAGLQQNATLWVLLAPLCAALALSLRDLVARGVPSQLPTAYNAAYSALFVCGAALMAFWTIPQLFPETFEPFIQGRSFTGVIADFDGLTWLKLACSSALIATAYYFSAQSLRMGELSVISPFRYVGLPGAMVLDVVLFQAVPQWNEYTGGVLIMLAGIIIILRESRAGKLRQPHPANRRG